MSLSHLLYVSRAAADFTDVELRELSLQCARRNHACAVTGLLIYSAGWFVQLLEGRETTLEALFKRISSDARHTEVQVLLREPVASRLFPRWSMGILNLDVDGTTLDRERLHALLKVGAQDSNTGAHAIALLREFRRQLPAAPSPQATAQIGE